MHQYDPELAPLAQEWLALGEFDRIDLVKEHHRTADIEWPNLRLHAVIHVVVENQLAEGHDPVIPAMQRLMSAGLSHHVALHAVGSVLAEHLFDLLHDDAPKPDVMVIYDAAVERLTVESWRNG